LGSGVRGPYRLPQGLQVVLSLSRNVSRYRVCVQTSEVKKVVNLGYLVYLCLLFGLSINQSIFIRISKALSNKNTKKNKKKQYEERTIRPNILKSLLIYMFIYANFYGNR